MNVKDKEKIIARSKEMKEEITTDRAISKLYIEIDKKGRIEMRVEGKYIDLTIAALTFCSKIAKDLGVSLHDYFYILQQLRRIIIDVVNAEEIEGSERMAEIQYRLYKLIKEEIDHDQNLMGLKID